MNSIINRSRLFASLNPQRLPRLIVIAAPSGFGKSIAAEQLAEWLDSFTVWHRLNQWERDWLRIAERGYALWGAEKSKDLSTLSPIQAGALLATSIQPKKPSLYVLDDVQHLIGSRNAELWLQSLIENLPPLLHVVLVGQDLPRLSWTQFLAHGWVWQLVRDDLRFSPAEIQALGQVSVEEAEALATRTEGWIAGLRLALNPGANLFWQDTTAKKPHDELLFEDLASSFFKRQSPDFQDFLLRSALPEQFDIALCKAVLGIHSIEKHIAILLRQHFFISIEHGAYRYHDLFRQFLLEHFRGIDLQRYQQLHKSFGLWYEKEEQLENAIWHFVQAGESLLASKLADKIAKEFQTLGRWESLLHILDILGEGASAQLQLYCGSILTEQNRLEESEKLLEQAQSRFQQQKDSLNQTRCHLQMAFNYNKQGRYQEALERAKAVLRDKLANEDLKMWAARVQGWSYLELGHVEKGIAALEKALPYISQQERAHGRSHLLQDLSIAYMSFGDLEKAGMLLQEVLALRQQINNPQDLAVAFNDLGFYYHCCSQYRDALRSLSEGYSYVARSGGRAASFLEWSKGDVLRDLGRYEEAEHAYLNALNLAAGSQNAPYLAVLMSMAQLRFWEGRQGDVAILLQEAQKLLIHPGAVRSRLLALMQQVFVSEPSNLDVDSIFASFDQLRASHCLMDLAQAIGFSACLLLRQRPDIQKRFASYVQCLPEDLLQALAANIHNLGLDYEPLASEALEQALNQLRKEAPSLVFSTYPSPALPISIELKSLGQASVVVNGEMLEESAWIVNTAKELFFFLYLKGQQTKEEITLAFWPERSSRQIRNAFHDTLKRLRRALSEAVAFDGNAYRINPQYRIVSDYEQFRDYVHRASQLPPHNVRAQDLLQKAVEMYKGILLPFIYSPWIETFRQGVEADYQVAVLGLAECAMARLDYATAISLYKRCLELSPYNESVLRRLMTAFAKAGEMASVQLAFDDFAKRLETDLDVSPSRESWDCLLYLLKANK